MPPCFGAQQEAQKVDGNEINLPKIKFYHSFVSWPDAQPRFNWCSTLPLIGDRFCCQKRSVFLERFMQLKFQRVPTKIELRKVFSQVNILPHISGYTVAIRFRHQQVLITSLVVSVSSMLTSLSQPSRLQMSIWQKPHPLLNRCFILLVRCFASVKDRVFKSIL